MTLDRHRTTSAVIAAWGLFAAMGLLMLGNGLLGTLLGVRAELEQFATTVTGVIMTAYFAGFLIGSQIAPKTLERVGHVRVFAALASMASAAPLIHSVFVNPPVWIVMRFVFGFCMAGLYVVAESWLNQVASNNTRGRLLSVYMLVVMGGMSIGQAFLGLASPQEVVLFVVASLVVSLAVVPISLSQGNAPPFHAPERLPAADLWRLAPLGIVAGFGVGLANGALVGIGPVYATRVGFSTGEVGLVVGAMLVGAIVWQWPIGHFSDKIPRRRAVLIVAALAAAAAAIGAQTATPSLGFILGVMFALGGLTIPLYSVVMSHIQDVVNPNQAVMASSIYVFIAGGGAALGPLLAAVAMDRLGVAGFFVLMAAVHGLVAAYSAYRVLGSERQVDTEDQLPWRPYPMRGSAVLARVIKARRTENGNRKRSARSAS